MKIFAKDKVVFNFSKANQPVYFVEPGETFWVETDDCYSGQIKTETVLRPDIDISIMDCSVGPIAVSGAEPGDVLCVEVLAIQLAEQGVMVTSPGLGVLGEKITEAHTKIIPNAKLAPLTNTGKYTLEPTLMSLVSILEP